MGIGGVGSALTRVANGRDEAVDNTITFWLLFVFVMRVDAAIVGLAVGLASGGLRVAGSCFLVTLDVSSILVAASCFATRMPSAGAAAGWQPANRRLNTNVHKIGDFKNREFLRSAMQNGPQCDAQVSPSGAPL